MSFYVPGCAETWQVKYYCPVEQQGPGDYAVGDMVQTRNINLNYWSPLQYLIQLSYEVYVICEVGENMKPEFVY